MKIVIQRVSSAAVMVDNKNYNEIKKGLLLFVCLEVADTPSIISKAAHKIVHLRIFEDTKKLMNLNILQSEGEILSISQFTLSWQGEKGNRPSFEKAMSPKLARLMYAQFNTELTKQGCVPLQGIFGANMKITSTNDGPVTFHLSF